MRFKKIEYKSYKHILDFLKLLLDKSETGSYSFEEGEFGITVKIENGKAVPQVYCCGWTEDLPDQNTWMETVTDFVYKMVNYK